MNILSATVIVGMGADNVSLKTDLPSPITCFPEEKLMLKFEATTGTGIEYVKKNFGIEPNVIKR